MSDFYKLQIINKLDLTLVGSGNKKTFRNIIPEIDFSAIHKKKIKMKKMNSKNTIILLTPRIWVIRYLLFYLLTGTMTITLSYGQYGGSTCDLAQSAPISFTVGTPFIHGNDTLFNKGNDYNSINTTLISSFSPTYLNGPDYVYYFTATTQGSITIKINYEGALTRCMSVSLFEAGTGFSLGTQIAGSYDVLGAGQHPGVLTIGNINAGTSYYIVVDGHNGWLNNAIKSLYSIEVFYNPVSPPCTNLGFENGNFDYWYGTSGVVQNCINPLAVHANYCPADYGTTTAQHSIITGGVDPFGGFPRVFEGNYSAMIGDSTVVGGKGGQLISSFEVNPASNFFTLNYAMVVADGQHEDTVQAFIKISMFDQNGSAISCGDYLAIAGDESLGFTESPSDTAVSFCQWQTVTTDLSGYMGQNITIVVTVGDCSELGHFAYAYLDCSCTAVELITSGCSPLNLSAPLGFDSYLWFPGGETTQTIENISAATYCCEMTRNSCTINICKDVIIEPFSYTLATVNSDCSGLDNGSVSINVSGIPNFSYYLSEGSSVNNTASTSFSINSLAEGTYSVTLTDGLGCTYIDTFEILNNYEIATMYIIDQDVSCFGYSDGIAIVSTDNLNPPYTFLWPDYSSSNVNSNLSAGIHNVTISDNTGCTSSLSVEMSEPDELVGLVTDIDTTSCFDSCDAYAQITVNGGTAPYYFLWPNGETNSFSNNLCGGLNYVNINDSNGCELIQPVLVEQPQALSVLLPEDYFLCNLDKTPISAVISGGTYEYTYYWSTSSTDSVITVSPYTTSTYWLTITDANGCVGTDSVEIGVYPEIVLEVSSDLDTVCPNTPVIISGVIYGGSGVPYTVMMNDSLVELPMVYYPNGTELLLFVASDSCSNLATDSLLLTTYPVYVPEFSSSTQNGCQPLEVEFSLANYCSECTYLWVFSDGINTYQTTDPNPSHTFMQNGNYNLTLHVSNEYYCVDSFYFENIVQVFPNPQAAFYPDPETMDIFNSVCSFSNQSNGASHYYWDFGDGSHSSLQDPEHRFFSSGSFWVELVAFTDKGCSDTIGMYVYVNDIFTFYAPTAFTPDLNGFNDIFRVFGMGIDNSTFNLYIYDRWGEVIFQSSDIEQGWDGTVKDRLAKAPIGSYVWLATFKDLMGRIHEYSGIINVLK